MTQNVHCTVMHHKMVELNLAAFSTLIYAHRRTTLFLFSVDGSA